MSIPNASDVKIFVPAKDFQLSLDFYLASGWEINWIHENSLAELELAGCRFFLQDYFVKQWAHNFMIYIEVDNAQEWYEHMKGVLESDPKFSKCRVNEPKIEPHGKVVHVWEPSGVLLHFTE